MDGQEIVQIYKLLSRNDIPVWLTGGWGIDALLERHTRHHKDMDVLVLFKDIARLCTLMTQEGFEIVEIWEENRWVVDPAGEKIATAFVMEDAHGRQLDVHAVYFDPVGNVRGAWDLADEFMLSREDMGTVGQIDGYPVRCISPEAQLYCHEGYKLPEKHIIDLKLLRQKFWEDR